MTKDFDSILNNFINGNLQDFEDDLKTLSKKELLELALLWHIAIGDSYDNINKYILRWL